MSDNNLKVRIEFLKDAKIFKRVSKKNFIEVSPDFLKGLEINQWDMITNQSTQAIEEITFYIHDCEYRIHLSQTIVFDVIKPFIKPNSTILAF